MKIKKKSAFYVSFILYIAKACFILTFFQVLEMYLTLTVVFLTDRGWPKTFWGYGSQAGKSTSYTPHSCSLLLFKGNQIKLFF